MKKIYTFTMLLLFGSVTFMSCGSARNSTKDSSGGTTIGGTVVRTVLTVVGAILLSKLLKSVFNTVGKSKAFAGLTENKDFMTNFNEETKLSTIAPNNVMKTALQVLVADHYKIPLATVISNYSSLNNAADLATFIGQNADAKVLEGIK